MTTTTSRVALPTAVEVNLLMPNLFDDGVRVRGDPARSRDGRMRESRGRENTIK
jgi:hypothetical protein